jgi:hypothetical protein
VAFIDPTVHVYQALIGWSTFTDIAIDNGSSIKRDSKQCKHATAAAQTCDSSNIKARRQQYKRATAAV